MRAALARKWQSGTLLTAFAGGQPWDPYGAPIRGPAPGEISERLGAVQEWAAEWRRAEQGPLRIEYKKVGGRHVGSNTIPSRAWIDGYDQAWTLLGVRDDVRRLVEMGQATGATCPRLMPWLQRHPMKALRLAACWPEMLATVQWIDQCQSPGMYLRQVDVPGVDTKFIERNRGVLGELLDLQLDPDRTDAGAADFESRYRFRRRPSYVRFRCQRLHGFSELSVRAEDFAARPAGLTRAYVVENEITYLAIPCPDHTMVIFGGGYAVPVLEPVGWLSDLDIVYWGDIDTHGFVILDRMRQRFPRARSMLMDRATLLAHREQWVAEPSPASVRLEHLDAAELALYEDLTADALGPSVRLEQERIRFGAIRQALLGS